MKISWKNIENWRSWKMRFFLGGHFDFFFSKKKKFFCFIPMKISPNLYGRVDGSKFWCFPWFPENSLLCIKLRYTVYIQCHPFYTHDCIPGINRATTVNSNKNGKRYAFTEEISKFHVLYILLTFCVFY